MVLKPTPACSPCHTCGNWALYSRLGLVWNVNIGLSLLGVGGKTTFYQTAVMYRVATCGCRELDFGRYLHSLRHARERGGMKTHMCCVCV